MKCLMILNDAPYGSERSYNGLRIARALLKTGDTEIKLFLIGDATACAKRDQKVPQGYYNIGDMLGFVASKGGEIGACGSCLDARGIMADELIEGVSRSTLDQLAEWTQHADKVFVF